MQTDQRSPIPAATGKRANRIFNNVQANCNPIEAVLDRLANVKKIGEFRWQARCPAHDDRSPSLSVTEGSEGTVLIKCWAGCSIDSIVRAIGLNLSDLFPKSDKYERSNAPKYSAREVVKTLSMEATIVFLGYRALERGDTLTALDQSRIETAIGAIENCRKVIR